ncbi:MAG: GDYXXLXY domain-containing protein [Nitrospinota bacterium]|nr:GDYXXLXY domain-containing protein [Nitrospinota bacterium]
MSRSFKFHLLIAAWIGVLLFMAGSKQYQIATGKKVLLEVVPIDPRHPFMGAYVQLNYAISTVEVDPLITYKKGADLFVTLVEKQGVWMAADASRQRPAAGDLYIRGLMQSPPWTNYQIKARLDDFADVRPTRWIESHPREVDKLREMEDNRWLFDEGDTIYIPLVLEKTGQWTKRYEISKSMEGASNSLSWYASRLDKEETAIISARVAWMDKRVYSTIRVKYGIEKYFATEEKAKELERIRNDRRLLVEAYVSANGGVTLGEMIIKPKSEP